MRHTCSFIEGERDDRSPPKSRATANPPLKVGFFDSILEVDERNRLDRAQSGARWYSLRRDSEFWKYQKLVITIVTTISLGLGGYYTTLQFQGSQFIAVLVLIASFGLLFVNPAVRKFCTGLIRANRPTFSYLKSYNALKLYFLKDREDILFAEHKRQLSGVGLFQVMSIALNIRPNFNRFMQACTSQRLPLIWVYNHAPYDELSEEEEDLEGVQIVFGIRKAVPALLHTEAKRPELYEALSEDLELISSAFLGACPHTRFKRAAGQELVNLFSMILRGGALIR
jgi:hypothetical protein